MRLKIEEAKKTKMNESFLSDVRKVVKDAYPQCDVRAKSYWQYRDTMIISNCDEESLIPVLKDTILKKYPGTSIKTEKEPSPNGWWYQDMFKNEGDSVVVVTAPSKSAYQYFSQVYNFFKSRKRLLTDKEYNENKEDIENFFSKGKLTKEELDDLMRRLNLLRSSKTESKKLKEDKYMRLKINEAKSKKLKESISSSDFNYLLDTFENEKKHNKDLKNVSVSYKGNTVIFSGLSKDEAKNLVDDLEEHVAWSLEADTSASIKEDGTVYITVYEDKTESKKLNELVKEGVFRPNDFGGWGSDASYYSDDDEDGLVDYYRDLMDELTKEELWDLIANEQDEDTADSIIRELYESKKSRKSDKKLRESNFYPALDSEINDEEFYITDADFAGEYQTDDGLTIYYSRKGQEVYLNCSEYGDSQYDEDIYKGSGKVKGTPEEIDDLVYNSLSKRDFYPVRQDFRSLCRELGLVYSEDTNY